MTSDTPAPAQEAHVEALARIICAAHEGDGCKTWENEDEVWRETYRDMARAILASDWLAAFVADRQAEAWDESDEASLHNRRVMAGVVDGPLLINPYRIGGASC